MKVDGVIRELETIRDLLAPVLADSHKHVVGAALKNLYDQKEKQGKKKVAKNAEKPPWKLEIFPTDPLTFRSTEDEPLVKHHLEVDLACSLSEPTTNGIPRGEHNIAVRVWSKEKTHLFRDQFDAPSLRKPIEAAGRRLMLKFHFDLANKDQEGPRHHLQIGGTAHGEDNHWLPENWKLPRFVHVPVNLVLACEFLARTFYPKQFKTISQEATWIHAVRQAEETYLYPFLKTLPCVSIQADQRKGSLFSSVWNA